MEGMKEVKRFHMINGSTLSLYRESSQCRMPRGPKIQDNQTTLKNNGEHCKRSVHVISDQCMEVIAMEKAPFMRRGLKSAGFHTITRR